jgi:biopolymer transport protein ExbB
MIQFKVKNSSLKKGFFCLFVPAVLFHSQLTAQPTGYSYGRSITIQGSQVTGSLSNFPVLISITDPSLKQAAAGGRLQNANGYDVIFTLPDCSTVLPMQLEKYTASTGEYIAWVKLPTLVANTNKLICMFYGKTGVLANPSNPAVWDANYMGVWHFNSSVSDGTTNGSNLTNTGTTNLTGSKIGDGRRLDNNPFVQSSSGSIKYLQLPNGMFTGVNNFTFEGWVYLETVTTSWERIFDFGKNTQFNMFLTPSTGTNGIKRFAITINNNGSEERLSSATSTGTSAWHHFAVTIDAASDVGVFYYDGVADVSGTIDLTPNDLGNTNANYFGRSQYGSDEGLYGTFDEFRISNSTRSAGWIATSYKNQNSPSTFYNISSELTATTLCSILPIKIGSFEAIPTNSGTVTISWTAEQENASDKYILERSANGSNWEAIKTINATGNAGPQKYTTQDLNPIYPVTYYRIQQVEANNSITYTQIISVKLNEGALNNNSFIVSPNPARQLIQLAFQDNVLPQQTRVELINNVGVKVQVQPDFNGNTISLKLPRLANGVYFLNVYIKDTKHTRKMLIAQ